MGWFNHHLFDQDKISSFEVEHRDAGRGSTHFSTVLLGKICCFFSLWKNWGAFLLWFKRIGLQLKMLEGNWHLQCFFNTAWWLKLSFNVNSRHFVLNHSIADGLTSAIQPLALANSKCFRTLAQQPSCSLCASEVCLKIVQGSNMDRFLAKNQAVF